MEWYAAAGSTGRVFFAAGYGSANNCRPWGHCCPPTAWVSKGQQHITAEQHTNGKIAFFADKCWEEIVFLAMTGQQGMFGFDGPTLICSDRFGIASKFPIWEM